MTKIPANVLKFAAGNTEVFDKFRDYWNHWRALNGAKGVEYTTVDSEGRAITFAEKEDEMNNSLVREILRRLYVACR